MPSKPVVLCILDGWGHAAPGACNAVTLAEAPVWRRWMSEAPHALIDASELHVGLPAGQMGNSEVGHMNIGAGRVVMQDLPRIDTAMRSGALDDNPALGEFIVKIKAARGRCHLLGLMSPGGVHSHQSHIAALGGRGEIETGLEREPGLEPVASFQMADEMVGVVQNSHAAIEIGLLHPRPFQQVGLVDNRAGHGSQVAR